MNAVFDLLLANSGASIDFDAFAAQGVASSSVIVRSIGIICFMRCLSSLLQPFTSKVSVMMILDRSNVRAVVLVVEDEMLLRMRAVDMVEDAGYTSVEAVDADEAMAILKSRSDIALLFTDIQMPGSMDGLKLAQTVRNRWSPVKIILVSGQLELTDIDLPSGSRFFGKPLEAEVMITQMRNMIGHA